MPPDAIFVTGIGPRKDRGCSGHSVPNPEMMRPRPERAGAESRGLDNFASCARIDENGHIRIASAARRLPGTQDQVCNCQPACKPGSVWRVAPPRRPFLWGADCSVPRATNPGGGEDRAGCQGCPWHPCRPYSVLLPVGFAVPPALPQRGALLPHRFTLACTSCPAPAVSSLWHFPWGRPRRPLAATVDPWSPDFPPPAQAAKPSPGSGRPAGWQEE